MHGANFSKRNIIYGVAALILLTIGIVSVRHCSSKPQEVEEEVLPADSVVKLIKIHSRLYTAEAVSHKTITYNSNNKMTVKMGPAEKQFNLPLGRLEAKIPVSVTYKAYVDMEKMSVGGVNIKNDSTIHITLPDPVITETAVAVDHEREVIHRQWFAKRLTDAQYQELITQAKQEAWNELSEKEQQDIIETAKISATDILLPQLRALGFTKVTIDYRKDFTIFKEKL